MSVSATRTERGAQAERRHDYLYDPIYTVSGEMDHVRRRFRAHASEDRMKRVPRYTSMFSDLPNHPSYSLCLDATDQVPPFIDQCWRGHMERRKDALNHLTGSIAVIGRDKKEDCIVSGADHWKFFKCSLIPFNHQVRPDVVFAVTKNNTFNVDGAVKGQPIPTHCTVSVQTDYRDSEAQTNPYSPQYILHPGTPPPELLTLATLSWDHGLPVGLAEVELIERVRVKRSWEATLPPLNDLSQLDKRRGMMEEMERKEWAFREEEIYKLQEARLTMIADILKEREKRQQQALEMKLKQSLSQHLLDKDVQLNKIHKSYNVSLRNLVQKRNNVERTLERHDIVKEYSQYSSQTYAPLSRIGVFPDHHPDRKVFKSRFMDTYAGLLELEASLPQSALEPRIKTPKPKAKTGFVRVSECREMEVMKTYQLQKSLKDEKAKVVEKRPLRFLYKTEKPVPHPPTPIVETPPEGVEERELAVICIQRLLRGRSIQSQMLEGKEKCLELIQELRTTHALQREEQELLNADKQVTLALQRQRGLHSNTVSVIQDYEAGVTGSVLVDILDFLSKELLRLHEERRIHALSMLAERQRCMREAKESGRRQIEERRCHEEDEIFKQVMNVHQDTVELYLNEIILGTIEQTADSQARVEIQRMAEEVNNIAYAIEERYSRTSLQGLIK
ncbi:cilia- and flagella-associated protein 91 [Denticeps clupeoides]|uniref:cilia- and flagella-associated protein 91 n=1 Tax=Denticeps clupeoides TaxID=299321 RepID=UPI0010A44D2B|nr:cilia- and flagella-associated protein 91 [Denticeps clupeoides]